MIKKVIESDIKIRLGYACLNLEMKKKYRTFRLKAIEENDVEKIKEVIQHNILHLFDILYANIKKNIYVYRITADIIPFASNETLQQIVEQHGILKETKIVKVFEQIRKWQEQYNMRLSMHTSHFVILVSPRKEVVEKSIEELVAQQKILRLVNGKNLILHIGGAYGDKTAALERLGHVIEHNKRRLDLELLTFENDDKTYTTEEVMQFCKQFNLKWVYDFHHERCNPSEGVDVSQLLASYPPDKYHISSGVDGINRPPHADFITQQDMVALVEQLKQADIQEADIILEAKKKNLAIPKVAEPLEEGYWLLKPIISTQAKTSIVL